MAAIAEQVGFGKRAKMSEFVLEPSEDARPSGKGEFISGDEEVESRFEETGTSPTGDAGTEALAVTQFFATYQNHAL